MFGVEIDKSLTFDDWSHFLDWNGLAKKLEPYFPEHNLVDYIKRAEFGATATLRFFPCENLIPHILKIGTNTMWYFPLLSGSSIPLMNIKNDKVGVFHIAVYDSLELDTFTNILRSIMRNFIAEAVANYLSYLQETRCLRPAFGYPICPEHSYKKEALLLLGKDPQKFLTQTNMLIPSTSICGLLIKYNENRQPYQTKPGQSNSVL